MATAADVRALTEGSFERRVRGLQPRELRTEAAFLGVVVLASAALLALAPAWASWAVVPVLLGHLLAHRVEFPVGAGSVVPTQPFLVALFAVAGPGLVPLLVLASLLASQAIDVVRQGKPADRVLLAGGDAVHVLGPAAVLAVAGTVTPAVVVAAFAAQLVADLLAALVRERREAGVRPSLQALVTARVWAVDAALLPLGLLAATATTWTPLAPLALVPLVALMHGAARERLAEVERANARLRALEDLRSKATTDELTGLANHRRFQEVAAAALAWRARTGLPVAVLMLDVDDFKRVNDTWGHAMGDRVLRGVAQALRGACRAGAVPARYGGEEFAVVLEGAGAEEAQACAERLRAAVAAHVPPGAPRVTVSVGAAVLGPDVPAAGAQALIEAADAALYAAKAAGKDQVVVRGNARSSRAEPGSILV
jgi:diguanylate cyclase (GGDEF)-like protein